MTVRFPNVRALPAIIARVRRVFDLGADVTAIGAHLARDPLLAPLVAERPGLRVPGGWDGFELAVRAILGQQVTVEAGAPARGRAARGRADGRCAAAHGRRRVPESLLSQRRRRRGRPIRGAARAGSGGAPARAAGVAEAALADPMLFQPLGTIEETAARLQALPGVGDWTAHYIALRAGREPDAFPATDVGLLRAWDRIGDTPAATNARNLRREIDETSTTSKDRHAFNPISERAARWRPWRGYAAQHLWTAEAARSAQGGSP